MMKYLLVGIFSLFTVTTAIGGDTFTPLEGQRTITVTGEGKATATPDVVYINLATVSDGETVGKAMAKSKVASTNIFAALKKNKVADKDICTKGFTLSPKLKYVKDEEPKVVGYTVSNEITVTVHEVAKAGDLLDALTAEGHANGVSGVTFDVLDKTKVSDAAREKAVADALRKAKLLAKASGCKLGEVLSISEGNVYTPRPYAIRAASIQADRMGDHVHTKGEQQFHVTVNLVIDLR